MSCSPDPTCGRLFTFLLSEEGADGEKQADLSPDFLRTLSAEGKLSAILTVDDETVVSHVPSCCVREESQPELQLSNPANLVSLLT